MRRAGKVKIRHDGAIVFSHAWNSGGPGAGAGVEYVFGSDGSFVVASSEDETIHGPYDSLKSAFEAHPELTVVSAATEAIEAVGIEPDDLVPTLSFRTPPEDGYTKRLFDIFPRLKPPMREAIPQITGECWLFSKDHKLVRVARADNRRCVHPLLNHESVIT